ncbi:MAG: aldolase [candidate division NC10 bacterium]|nr:aldolase [candidate division NC10 bacterium]
MVWGTFVFEYGSPAVPRIMKAAGWDYILIDTEHASFGMETVGNLLHVSAAVGLPAVVRVPEAQRSLLSRPLDAGAMGVMIPRVESRAQAEEIVRYTKYFPMGDRGVALGTAHSAYQAVNGKQFIREANTELLIIMQIETQQGMESLDDILSVPGLSVAYLGPHDLSTSMGMPGAVGHPRVVQAITAFLRGCKRHGVIPGIWVDSIQDGRAWMRRGARFMTYGADFSMVMERSRMVLDAVHPKGRSHGRRPR